MRERKEKNNHVWEEISMFWKIQGMCVWISFLTRNRVLHIAQDVCGWLIHEKKNIQRFHPSSRHLISVCVRERKDFMFWLVSSKSYIYTTCEKKNLYNIDAQYLSILSIIFTGYVTEYFLWILGIYMG
jgi:hypothetical protein